MNRDDIKPVVWPTEEPEVAARPTPEQFEPEQLLPGQVDSGRVESGQLETDQLETDRVARTSQPAPSAAAALPASVEEGSSHAFIWHNAPAAAAVMRTLMLQEEGGGDDGPLAGMSARQLAAAFMSSLGSEVGARVMRELGGDIETEWVARAVAEEAQVSHSMATQVLDVVRRRIEEGNYLADGGHGYAARLLQAAFGCAWRRGLLRPPHAGFQVLRDVAPEQVAPFISHEHPQTIAILLSQLEPAIGAGILSQLTERLQADVSYRIATMENVDPEMLIEVEEALEASLRDMLAGDVDVGGTKVVADILNLTGSSVEKNVLDQMDAQAPEVAEPVRNLMFVFADIARLSDHELQILLKEVDEKQIAIGLKAADEQLKERLHAILSSEVWERLAQTMEEIGPMRLAEVEEVQLRIVQRVRQLEENGQVTIVRGTDDSWV